jgi:hypothetical protein
MGYLYRAVDKQGKTVDSLFQSGRGRSGHGLFSQSACVLRATMAAENYTGWTQT